MPASTKSQNFSFLRTYEPQLDRLGALAERYFAEDPETCLIKLRQFAELLARQTAARNGLAEQPEESQADLLRRLRFDAALPPQVLDLFHQIRVAGNQAVHDNHGDHLTALTGLKLSRQLAIWFHRTYGHDTAFTPGPFQPPSAPAHPDPDTLAELEAIRAEQRALLDATARAGSPVSLLLGFHPANRPDAGPAIIVAIEITPQRGTTPAGRPRYERTQF